MMNNYPDNDYRDYLMHWGGGSSSSHKYISKHRGKSGKWVYIYEKAVDAVGDAGRAAKRQYDLATSRHDIRKRMAGKHTTSELNRLRDEGRVSWNGARASNFGKENEYSKERRTSTKIKNKANKLRSAFSVSLATKHPKLDTSIQKAKNKSSRVARKASGILRKIKNKQSLRKAIKDIKKIRSNRSSANGFPKLYNKMMAEGRITPQNQWMTDNKRRTRMTRRPETW